MFKACSLQFVQCNILHYQCNETTLDKQRAHERKTDLGKKKIAFTLVEEQREEKEVSRKKQGN